MRANPQGKNSKKENYGGRGSLGSSGQRPHRTTNDNCCLTSVGVGVAADPRS